MKQSDTAAAISKAESSKAMLGEISTQEENMREELLKIELMAKRNTLLQGLITSESERRKKVIWTIITAYLF